MYQIKHKIDVTDGSKLTFLIAKSTKSNFNQENFNCNSTIRNCNRKCILCIFFYSAIIYNDRQ